MNWWNSIVNGAKSVVGSIVGIPGSIGKAASGLAQQINRVAAGADFLLTHPFEGFTDAMSEIAGIITGNNKAAYNAEIRMGIYTKTNLVGPQVQWLRHQVWALWQQIGKTARMLTIQIVSVQMQLQSLIHRLIAREREARIQDFRRSEAYARARVKWALATVQKEAASGYRMSLRDQNPVIVRLAEAVIERDPLLRDLVSEITRVAIDAIEIDDPVLEIAVSFALKEVIEHLGVDRLLGDALKDLLAPIIGHKPPSNLHAVIAALSGRIAAMEADWARFMADGGPQILQAGEMWRNITSATSDIALAGFFTFLATDPATAARETVDVILPVVTGITGAVNDVRDLWR